MNGTIICTLDEEEGTRNAAEVARNLAKRFDARLLFVTVAASRRARGGDADDARWENARTARPSPFIPGASLDEERLVAVGDPAEAVAMIASEEAADLIVVGGRRGRFGHILRSPLAEDLALTAPCPVVVVSSGAVESRAIGVRRPSLAERRR